MNDTGQLVRLFGDVSQIGFSFEYFSGEQSPAIGERNSSENAFQICCNVEGSGHLLLETGCQAFAAEKIWFGKYPAQAVRRETQQTHRFLNLRMSQTFLREHLPPQSGNLCPEVRSFLSSAEPRPGIGRVRPLSGILQAWVVSVRRPPVLTAARPLWYRVKALELVCDVLFEAPEAELFCHRQQRIAEDRAARVKEILERHLAAPPNLKEIGKQVGCSPYHLSRIFSREVGMTIPQYLRQRRMEKAGSLLREGSMNVTEVAMEVGYSSVSHFSQAFCQTMGCCPTMYPAGAE
jgi:AraC-like DNA-binding protein